MSYKKTVDKRIILYQGEKQCILTRTQAAFYFKRWQAF